MPEASANLSHLATITSRVEALVIASLLEHAGVRVWIDGVWHASIDPLFVALGGHRLRVFAGQWQEASQILREVGLPEAAMSSSRQPVAVLRFLAIYLASQLFFLVPGVLIGAVPPIYLAEPLLTPLGVQVDPRGPNEYHLAQPA